VTRPIALEGIFFRLVREGLPLGIRDLNHALRALEAGFGLGNRERLLWLCQTLWARTDEENRRLDVLFREHLPPPTTEEVSALTGRPAPAANHESGESGLAAEEGGEGEKRRPELQALEILGAGQPGGIGLPKASVTIKKGESFIVTPKPLVHLRACAIAWRRHRRPLRTGPKVELDLEQTILAKARQGFLPEPVLVGRRRNLARVVLLVDASPAMATWVHSTAVLVESLSEGHFGAAGIFYFHETPEHLFEQLQLTRPALLSETVERFAGASVMVVSEAGSLRGGFDQQRIEKTRKALRQFGQEWRPLAWLNPMPRARWTGTTAASIGKLPGVFMIPFTPDGLIEAVDLLRGRR
jgi:uncharacterized protein